MPPGTSPPKPAATIKLELVTPAKARQWLEDNTENRKISPPNLHKLKSEVEKVGWRLTSDAVAFDERGILQNAQHRLTILAEGEASAWFFVARNMPPESWHSTDRGKPRTLADTLRRMGEARADMLAGVIRNVHLYKETRALRHNSGGKTFGESTHIQFFTDNQSIRDSVKDWGVLGLTDMTASAIHACFAMAHGKEEADAFFDLVKRPVNLDEEHPVFQLRTRIEKSNTTTSSNEKLDPIVRMALWIIAYNKWYRGDSVRSLRWRRGGANPEPFPQIDGFPFSEPEVADFT